MCKGKGRRRCRLLFNTLKASYQLVLTTGTRVDKINTLPQSEGVLYYNGKYFGLKLYANKEQIVPLHSFRRSVWSFFFFFCYYYYYRHHQFFFFFDFSGKHRQYRHQLVRGL